MHRPPGDPPNSLRSGSMERRRGNLVRILHQKLEPSDLPSDTLRQLQHVRDD